MGFESDANKKAEIGNIVHKSLELLAEKKLTIQDGSDSFHSEELNKTYSVTNLSPEDCTGDAFDYYSTSSKFEWTEDDLKECQKLVNKVLTFNDGQFNPEKLHVLEPEKYFDIEIDKPWAKYSYKLPDGTVLDGNLHVLGTVDFLYQSEDGSVCYVDYKTGKKTNYKTNKDKTYEDLEDDEQLLLYYYALNHFYPDRNIVVTIYFVRHGPESICYGPEDIVKAEKMIQDRFERIKNAKTTKLAYDNKNERWKCKNVPCNFYYDEYENSGQSKCFFMRDQLLKIGMDRVIEKYGDLTNINKYGSGGGQTRS